ncbi:MAG: hypothetical protein HGA80_02450 [Candidatus Omnitrophica bacterium]|nr:hypothetical protein [Candidatus Omnitrophota bacterium]
MSTEAAFRKTDVQTYLELYRQVKEVLLEGQRQIEAEKVRIYWEAGRLIREHLLQNSGRAEYGREVVARLARDLAVSKDLLHRCAKFHQTYPDFEKVAARPQLSWTHFKKLITVPDEQERVQLEETAEKGAWSSDELAERIRSSRPEPEEELPVYRHSNVQPAAATMSLLGPLTPLRGELYTYRIIRRQVLPPGAPADLVVDLGFSTYRYADSRLLSLFSSEDIVECRQRDDIFRFFNTDRTEKDLYTYRACVERVVDGDTLKVHVDLGFGTWTRQSLRLRGIDAPELGTKEGEAAKVFLQSVVKESAMLVIRSSRSDKFDRYLADVFVPQGDLGEDIFINNLLVEKGYALRWED